LLIGAVAFDAARTARSGLPGDGVVDVAAEDQAIAMLGLYRSEVDVLSDLLYPPNGGFDDPDRVLSQPQQLSATASRGAQSVSAALRSARSTSETQPLVERYLYGSDHDRLVDNLGTVAAEATAIELLESAHQAVIEGSGPPPSPSELRRLASRSSTLGDAYAGWAQALGEHTRGSDRSAQAQQARAATVRSWWDRVRRLQPGSQAELHFALRALPDATITALRGHPVAGPALQRLDSTGTPS
jgi:hypothetical protein